MYFDAQTKSQLTFSNLPFQLTPPSLPRDQSGPIGMQGFHSKAVVSLIRPYIEILVSSEPLTTAQRGRICDSVEGAESLTLIFKLDKNVKSYFLLFLKKKLKIRIPFCGPLIPLSWTFGDVCPGLQSRSRSLTCTLHLLYAMDSLDSPLL